MILVEIEALAVHMFLLPVSSNGPVRLRHGEKAFLRGLSFRGRCSRVASLAEIGLVALYTLLHPVRSNRIVCTRHGQKALLLGWCPVLAGMTGDYRDVSRFRGSACDLDT